MFTLHDSEEDYTLILKWVFKGNIRSNLQIKFNAEIWRRDDSQRTVMIRNLKN